MGGGKKVGPAARGKGCHAKSRGGRSLFANLLWVIRMNLGGPQYRGEKGGDSA